MIRKLTIKKRERGTCETKRNRKLKRRKNAVHAHDYIIYKNDSNMIHIEEKE